MSNSRHVAVKRAAEAHTDLTLFGAIATLLRSGCVYGDESIAAALQIAKACGEQQGRLRREYQSAMAALTRDDAP